MNSFIVVLFILCFVSWTNAAPGILDKEVKNGPDGQPAEDDDPLDDRINLSWGKASAHAKDDKGGYSGVETNSWGIQAGIKNVHTGQYTSLGGKAGSQSTAYSSGKDAPKTWADTKSTAGEYAATGSSTAGFSGGTGTSKSETHSQTQEYDLGGGNVLLSNLSTKKKDKKGGTKVKAENEEETSNEKSEQQSEVVFE